jgi:hypothetical protein
MIRTIFLFLLRVFFLQISCGWWDSSNLIAILLDHKSRSNTALAAE